MKQTPLPYNNILTQIFTAIGYSEDEFEDLMLLFYTGMLKEFMGEDAEVDKLNKKIKSLFGKDLTEVEFLQKLRSIILGEESADLFDRKYRKYLCEYIASFYGSLDTEGKEMVDNIANKYNLEFK
jgi:DNA-directed RNA polymerase delta subunit